MQSFDLYAFRKVLEILGFNPKSFWALETMFIIGLAIFVAGHPNQSVDKSFCDFVASFVNSFYHCLSEEQKTSISLIFGNVLHGFV